MDLTDIIYSNDYINILIQNYVAIKCSSYAEPAVFRSLSRAESAAGKSLRRSSLYRASKTFYAALHALTGSLRDCPDAESLRRRIYRQKCNLRFSGHRH